LRIDPETLGYLLKQLYYVPCSEAETFTRNGFIAGFTHYSCHIEIREPLQEEGIPVTHMMLIGDLALKDFLYLVSLAPWPDPEEHVPIRQHEIRIEFDRGIRDEISQRHLEAKMFQLLEYFWWDFQKITVFNACDTEAGRATLKVLTAPRWERLGDHLRDIQALRLAGDEDFKTKNMIGALTNYETARSQLDVCLRSGSIEEWLRGEDYDYADYLHMSELQFVLFSNIAAVYLELAQHSVPDSPDRIQLAASAMSAGKRGLNGKMAGWQPSETQAAKILYRIAVAAHMVGELDIARRALLQAAQYSKNDSAIRQELRQVEEELSRRSKTYTRSGKNIYEFNKTDWTRNYFYEHMVSIKLV